MKIKTYLKKTPFWKGANEKLNDLHCLCPDKGQEVCCYTICEKCNLFNWYSTNCISCNYGKTTQLTIKKEVYATEYHIETLQKETY